MKKFNQYVMLVFLTVCFFMAGCSALKKGILAYDLASKDEVVKAEMVVASNEYSQLAKAVGVCFPSTAPYIDLISQFVGMIASFVVGMQAGKRKKEGV